MLRSKLTFLVLVIAILAVAQIANANAALSVGGGVTMTESSAGVSMGTRIDAVRKIADLNSSSDRYEFVFRPIASWFSTTGFMPSLVMSKEPGRPVFRAYADFNNVNNIQKVELTPDHGLTKWEATNVALKGYQVEIPFLEPGGYAFEWRVTSKDNRNRIVIIIIPINWTSNRTNTVVQQILVQSAPESCWAFTDEQWVAMLSPAFQPLTALPDPAYLAKRAAQQQVLSQMGGGQSQTLVQPEPMSEPKCEVKTEPKPQPKPLYEPKKLNKKVEKKVEVESDGVAIQEDSRESFHLNGQYLLVLTGKEHGSYLVKINGVVFKGSLVTFSRKGKTVLTAKILESAFGKIYAETKSPASGGVRDGDRIIFDVEEGN